MPELLDDFLSRDSHRVWSATWATIRSRDPEVLDPLVAQRARIRAATADLEMGGMLRSNSADLEHALDKLDRYARGLCWCESYPDMSQHEPKKEETAGHVRIRSTSEPGWSMTYVCECTVCGRVFDVEQGDYHYMWWKWVPRGVKRSR